MKSYPVPSNNDVQTASAWAERRARKQAARFQHIHDEDAVIGEAMLAVAQAHRNYAVDKGASFQTFCYTSVSRALTKETQRQWPGGPKQMERVMAGGELRLLDLPPLSLESLEGYDPVGEGSPEEDYLQREHQRLLHEVLHQALDQLRDSDAAILRMRWLEGKKIQEICQTLKLCRDTVYRRERRGMARLQELLSPRLGELLN